MSPEAAWWAAFDEMIDAAEERGIKLVPVMWWNTFLFADMADEPLGETFAAESASRTLLFDYTRKLAIRYADSPTIAFWELTNEINLSADLDYAIRTDSRVCVSCGTPAARSAADNYATAEMVTTLVAMGHIIREEDPYHLISAGYSAPRESAWHLQASPEWTGADWTTDSIAELEAYVALVTPDPIDIVSIHIYQGDGNNQRLGVTGTFDPDAIAFLQDAADTINKPLYLGEFGDSAPVVSETPESNFARRSMWLALERRIPVSTHWVWEFYQFNPSEKSAHSIEPGIDDALISVMSEVATRLADASTTRGTRLPVSNHDMEEDSDSDGLVDGWETVWREGTSTGWSAAIYNGGDVFEGSADLRLTSGTGDASSTVYALSDPVAVSAGSTVVLTFALRENVGGAESATFAIVEYDGDGTELVEHGRAVTSPGGLAISRRVGHRGTRRQCGDRSRSLWRRRR